MLAAERQIVGHRTVEHDAAHALRVAARVLLRHPRAVGNANQIESRRAQRLAQRFQIAHCSAGRVELWRGARCQILEAITQTLKCAGPLTRLTAERVRATRATLVHQHQQVPATQRFEGGGDGRKIIGGRASRTTVEKHNGIRISSRYAGAHHGNPEFDLPACRQASHRRLPVFGHGKAGAIGAQRCYTRRAPANIAGLELQATHLQHVGRTSAQGQPLPAPRTAPRSLPQLPAKGRDQ